MCLSSRVLRYGKAGSCVLLGALSLLLSGCNMSTMQGTAGAPAGLNDATPIAGRANGGEPAISGANVYLVFTGAAGYGTGDTIAGTATTSTDGAGTFTITRNSTNCVAPEQAYLVVQGGNTGGGTNNPQNLLVAAAGSCGSIPPFIDVDEVTTVAAAYALGNFATVDSTPPYVHIGASANNSNATGSAVSIAFGTPTAPSAGAGATAALTFPAATTPAISGAVNIVLAGGAPLTGTISNVTTPAGFASAFNAIPAFSGAGISAGSSGNTVTVTGPAGVTNTLGLPGTSFFGANAAGLVHAFLNAANLANVATGSANTAIPSSPTTVVVTPPTTMVNALANIAQACVNSTGGTANSSAPTFSAPSTPSPTAVSTSSLYFASASSGINGTVDVTFAGGSLLSGSITGATSPATFVSQFNGISAFANAVPTLGVTNVLAPTSTTSATAAVTGIGTVTNVNGTVSVSLAGGAAMTDPISSTGGAAAFITAFNAITDIHAAGIIATANGNKVTLTGPVGASNTLDFTGTSLTASGTGALSAAVSGNTVVVTGVTGAANTISFSGTSLTGTGSDGSTCGNLFALTPSLGGSVPTNTFQALMNLAKNPWVSVANVTNLWNLIPPQVAFTPYPSSAPQDFTLAFQVQFSTFPTGGTSAGTSSFPYRIALDANDTAYVFNQDVNSAKAANLYALPSNIGSPVVTAGVNAIPSFNVIGMSADALGNLWFGNQKSSKAGVYQVNASTGAVTSTYATVANIQIGAFAIDHANNIWLTASNVATGNLLELPITSTASNGTFSAGGASVVTTTGATGSGGGGGYALNFDSFQNLWIADYFIISSGAPNNGYTASVLPNTGTVASPCYASYSASSPTPCSGSYPASTTLYALGGTEPISIVMDGQGSASSPATLFPAQGNYSFNAVADDSAGGEKSGCTTTCGSVALNELPVTVAVSSAGLLTTTVGTNVIIPASTTTAPLNNMSQPEFQMAVDGAGYIWMPDLNLHEPLVFKGATIITEPNGFTPCIQTVTGNCTGSQVMGNIRAAAIDSAGSVWIVSTSATASKSGVYQIIGTASPAWPLLQTASWGVEP